MCGRVGLEDSPFSWNRWYVEEDLTSGLAEEIEYDKKKPAVRKSGGKILQTQAKHTLVFLTLEIGERFKSPRSSLGMTALNYIRHASPLPSPPKKKQGMKGFIRSRRD